jgi:hypothetical protein
MFLICPLNCQIRTELHFRPKRELLPPEASHSCADARKRSCATILATRQSAMKRGQYGNGIEIGSPAWVRRPVC